MKRIKYIILIFLISQSVFGQTFIREQILFDGNNISTWIQNTGTFNKDDKISNAPGFMWPKGSNRYVAWASGFIVSGKVNDTIRMVSASYQGEYRPGYCINGQFFGDLRFKFYNVRRGDNYINNPDWLNWGQMVPFGAPYVDVDKNGNYNYLIDTPGVSNASQTIFICFTDADSNTHSSSGGFGGGTKPLGAEVHLTAWAYDHTNELKDIQFFKYEVVNKSNNVWNGTHYTFYNAEGIGDASDDYLGCDTNRNLAFFYNADNQDGNGNPPTYGLNPPAVGIMFLNNSNVHTKMTSFLEQVKAGNGLPFCELEVSNYFEAYQFCRGLKKDLTPYVVPLVSPPRITKYSYPGDPESGTGWNYPFGKIDNCGGALTGNLILNFPGYKWLITSYGNDNLNVVPNDRQTILYAQLIARGSNNLNSVTLLKQLADTAIRVAQNFTVGINSVSNEIPSSFILYQNYPNPFNPETVIHFEITPLYPPFEKGGNGGFVQLKVYDVLGQEVATLVNEKLSAGSYEVEWNAADFPSGIYFYSLYIDGVSADTKRMILLK